LTLKDNIIASWLGGKRGKSMPALGPRELDVLDQLWRHEELSARLLRERLTTDLSLNTVQSTLERLYQKGLVNRRKQGRAFIYNAAMSRSDIVSRVLGDLARDIGGGDLAPIISGFAEFLAEDDAQMQQRLLQMIQAAEQRHE